MSDQGDVLRTERVLLIDECDGMEPGGEGSPIDLAQKRTLSFSDRKIVMGSTPGVEDLSFICPAYEASDKRIFETPCPACGTFTEILWQHIEWKPGHPETATFRCPHCWELIEESHKLAMIEAGRWTITAPEGKGHAGFRLNSLTSPLSNVALEDWGLTRLQKCRALRRLETLGLVEVERQGKASPRVKWVVPVSKLNM
jgi:phage terminase large subunit GpA-like protein